MATKVPILFVALFGNKAPASISKSFIEPIASRNSAFSNTFNQEDLPVDRMATNEELPFLICPFLTNSSNKLTQDCSYCPKNCCGRIQEEVL